MAGFFGLSTNRLPDVLRRLFPKQPPATSLVDVIKAASALVLPLPSPDTRLKHIFPPGFDSVLSSSSCAHSPYSLALDQLLNILAGQGSYNPNNNVEFISVKNAWYGKQTISVKHEFIIVEVQDTKIGLRNYLILDRNNGEATETALRGLSQVSSSGTAAKDQFRVSYDGDKDKLLRQCNLYPYDTLEEINFTSDQPLLLYQLAIIAKTAAEHHEKYNLIRANCYWFAGLIWECMLQLRRKSQHRHLTNKRKRGRFRSTRQTIDKTLRELTCTVTIERVRSIESDLSKFKDEWSKGNKEALLQKIEEYKRELQEKELLLKGYQRTQNVVHLRVQ
ncbi:hypothetical protein B0J17DRAFT_717049 [Rhizoctonia solani]|nr:hypothetical protein B0J17DRAFT_717049 [Rhizoctonia solani]